MKNILITVTTLLALMVGNVASAALNAVVSATPNPAVINQPVSLSISITNGGSALSLTNLNITASYNGVPGTRVPAAFSVLNIGPNAPNLSLAGNNATTVVPMQAVFFAPSTGVTGSGTGVYYIGANFQASDGSYNSASTAAQETVNPLPLPITQE